MGPIGAHQDEQDHAENGKDLEPAIPDNGADEQGARRYGRAVAKRDNGFWGYLHVPLQSLTTHRQP